MGRKRRTISRELKLKVAVEALKNETTVQELATKYQVTPSMVSNWKKVLEKGDLSLLGEDKETKKLKEDLE
ncbi:MAG: transposase, partial [Peptostreptococcaceae bacterium]|nr:transposase [Peptostreptococcaceae bacterium]